MKKRRIVSLLLAAAILAAALTGCANLKVGLMLLQHATGPYDPMDQVMEDRLNAILEAAVAQDAAAIKAQFAPNAIAAQPELDSQIEALLDYYAGGEGEVEIFSLQSGDSSKVEGQTSSFVMRGRITANQTYLVYMRAVTKDSANPENVGIWTFLLLRAVNQPDYPDNYIYLVEGESHMTGIYVGLPGKRNRLGGAR